MSQEPFPTVSGPGMFMTQLQMDLPRPPSVKLRCHYSRRPGSVKVTGDLAALAFHALLKKRTAEHLKTKATMFLCPSEKSLYQRAFSKPKSGECTA